MKLYFEKNGFATIKNDYKLPDGFPKDVTEKLYKRTTLSGQQKIVTKF